MTFWAWGPLAPWTTSNSTSWFSARDRKPSPVMALKWTKTSGPSSREMNPNPLASLNHLTLPFSFMIPFPPEMVTRSAPEPHELKAVRQKKGGYLAYPADWLPGRRAPPSSDMLRYGENLTTDYPAVKKFETSGKICR